MSATSPLRFRNLLCSISLLASPAFAQDPVLTMNDIAGEWSGTAGQSALTLQATSEGALLSVKQRMLSCEFVIEPNAGQGGFKAYLTENRLGTCSEDMLTFTKDGDTLHIAFTQWADQGALSQSNGPSQGKRTFPTATIRGVALGTPLNEVDTVFPQGTQISRPSSSRRVIRGVKLLDGQYRQMGTPYQFSGAPNGYTEDNMGFYTVKNDVNDGIMAITRYYAPSPQEAPSFTVFEQALMETYGTPQRTHQEGPRFEYEWHFGLDGTAGDSAACQRKVPWKDPGRGAAMLFRSLDFFGVDTVKDGEGRFAPKLQPRYGCGYTLNYVVFRRQDGLLKSAEAVFFDHRALSTEMWGDQAEDITKDIQALLQRFQSTADNAAKL